MLPAASEIVCHPRIVLPPRATRALSPAPGSLDHGLIAVADLAAAAREIEARHGLASVEDGRQPDWGTAPRIVPLGRWVPRARRGRRRGRGRADPVRALG